MRLPGIAYLAAQAGVAKNSMWKATGQLKKNGILEGGRGQNHRIVDTDPAKLQAILKEIESDRISNEPVATLSGYRRIADMIVSDIKNGSIAPGRPLPSLKELIYRYASSYRTIRKALVYLDTHGIISRHKQGYAVPGLPRSRKKKKVAFFIITDRNFQFRPDKIIGSFCGALEQEASIANCSIDVYQYALFEDEMRFYNRRGEPCPLIDSDDIFGYAFAAVTPERKRDRILRTLSHLGKPVAIFDAIGGWKMPQVVHSHIFQLFSCTNSHRCGLDMGRYFLSLGHRQIAYISPFHQASWSKNRLDGLRQAYGQWHYEEAVKPCILAGPPEIFKSNRDTALEQSGFDTLKNAYGRWKRNCPPYLGQSLDSYFDFVFPWQILPAAQFQRRIEPLFEQALSGSRCTAWVCCNDEVALMAREYLDRHRLAVPSDISLAGFDDSVPALHNGLTSYNFNLGAAAHAMMDFILTRSSRRRQTHGKTVEIDGSIIERVTTAPLKDADVL
ncbi:MAG: GntR family transcriptional regulator [Chitinivibrionales bacterium]|nr:GntR family transcriptional regulator [Chitinivibrionales bacterium]